MEGKVSALVWNLMVHKPWQVVEFGSVAKAKTYEADILKYEPESDGRKEVVKELADKQKLFSKSGAFQLQRIVILIVLGIFNLLIFAFLTAFCLLIVGFQFLTLFYMLLGIFVFLLALIPYYGMELVQRWCFRILSACGTKILLAFVLSITLVFMDAMYKFVDTMGLLNTLFMITVIIFMIYIKRNEIIGLFVNFRSSEVTLAGAPQRMNHHLYKDLNIIPNFSSMTKISTNEAEGNSPSTLRSPSESGTPNNMNKDTQHSPGESAAVMKQAAGSITRSTQDMSRYYHKAEELLQKQYENSKSESDDAAEKKGTNPEYGAFVRRTDAVRKLGAGQFDQRDVSSAARILKRVEEKGGDVENVIADSKISPHPEEVKRPMSLADRSTGAEVVAFEKTVSGSMGSERPVKAGIDYFRENFGEEKGEEFFEAMSRKYDAFTVAGFASTEKLTYAQVQRQLKEKEQIYKMRNNQRTRARTTMESGSNSGEPINMRSSAAENGEDYGK